MFTHEEKSSKEAEAEACCCLGKAFRGAFPQSLRDSYLAPSPANYLQPSFAAQSLWPRLGLFHDHNQRAMS
jgi:hypothetical protein